MQQLCKSPLVFSQRLLLTRNLLNSNVFSVSFSYYHGRSQLYYYHEFSNIFNDSVGAINTQVIPFINQLPFVDISAISWKTDPNWTKVAIILVQGWLGFPYIYVMVTGILQSISEDLYEAAKSTEQMHGSAFQTSRFLLSS